MSVKSFYLDRWNAEVDGELNSVNLEKKLTTKYKHDFYRYNFSKGWSIGNHTHDENKADAILGGKMELTIFPANEKSETFVLEKGDILYLPSGFVHKARVLEDCVFYDSFK